MNATRVCLRANTESESLSSERSTDRHSREREGRETLLRVLFVDRRKRRPEPLITEGAQARVAELSEQKKLLVKEVKAARKALQASFKGPRASRPSIKGRPFR